MGMIQTARQPVLRPKYVASGGGATLLFTHDIENNSLTPASGVTVTPFGSPGANVSTLQAFSGTHSIRQVDNEEVGYELAVAVPSITIQWRMRIPNNYASNRVYPGIDGPNNKVARIYGTAGYGSSEKVGFSTYEPGSSPGHTYPVDECVPEWGAPGGNIGAIGPKGTGTTNHWVLAEEGTFPLYKMFYAPPQGAGAGNRGTLKFWKNGTLLIDETGTVDNYWNDPSELHDVKFFYLLGPANSQYSPQTPFYIDDLSVWSGEA